MDRCPALALALLLTGACEDPGTADACQDPCPDREEPVCGEDGRTYANACEAACARREYAPGACPPGCSLAETARLLHQTGGTSSSIDAVRTSSGTLVVWQETDDTGPRVLSLALDDDGLPISGPHLVQRLDGSPAEPHVTHVQEDVYAVAWLQAANPSSCGPLGLRLIDGGGVPIADPLLALDSASLACVPPSLAWTGEHVVVVASEDLGDGRLQPKAYRFEREAGFEEAAIPLVEPGELQSVRATWSSVEGQLLVTRIEVQPQRRRAHLLRADASGATLSRTVLFDDDTRFLEPAVLPSGAPVVLWDAAGSASSLRLGFVAGDGLSRTVAFADDAPATIEEVSNLVIGSGGLGAAWSDARDGTVRVYASVSDFEGERFSADLLVSELDEGPASDPAMVATADGFLVLWRDAEQAGGNLYVRSVECRW